MAAPLLTSSFPNPSLGETSLGDGPSDLDLRLASSTETRDVRGSAGGGNSIARQRRRKRLDKNSGVIATRLSPATISEHLSMDQSDCFERDNSSADVTAETTMLSAETPTPETPPEYNHFRVRKMSITPPTKNGLFAPEITPLPQSILTTMRTFPPPDEQIPTRLYPSRVALTQRSQSLWDANRSSSTQQHSIQRIPTAPVLSTALSDEPKSFPKLCNNLVEKAHYKPKPKSKVASSRPRPKLKKHSTAPSSTVSKQTNVVDDALMDRAFVIRQNLLNCEMQELAAEAERAAESGLERFIGSTPSKFGVEAETPPYRPRIIDDDFVVNSTEGGFMTPSRSSFTDALSNPMDYTPSYFSRKKIPVTSLRNVSEIVPNFSDVHNNIRLHLGRVGVDPNTIPDLRCRQPLIKNDTEDTEKEEDDDAISQAPSHAGSISSFSSYAVASLHSLKEMIEFVNRPKSPMDNNILRTSSSMSNASRDMPKGIEGNASSDAEDLRATRRRGINPSSSNRSTLFKPAVAYTDSDSDDSSVEFYGRKTPIDPSLRSVSSTVSEKRRTPPLKSSLSMPTRSSNVSSSGDINQPVFHRKKIGGASVSFETEKASYRALLDRMHGNSAPNKPTDVDQTTCAPSITNIDVDILPSNSNVSDKSTPMATFLSKLGTTFSRSASKDAHHTLSKDADEDNRHFVSNFFYTSQTSNISDDPIDAATLTLEINPERSRSDTYCLPGCGPNSIITACDVATKLIDTVFDWFNAGGSDQNRNSSAIAVPKSPRTWQSTKKSENNQMRLFRPPKLSFTHDVGRAHEAEVFCPESGDIVCSPGA